VAVVVGVVMFVGVPMVVPAPRAVHMPVVMALRVGMQVFAVNMGVIGAAAARHAHGFLLGAVSL
jgi:hypothetical protein